MQKTDVTESGGERIDGDGSVAARQRGKERGRRRLTDREGG